MDIAYLNTCFQAKAKFGLDIKYTMITGGFY